MLEYISDQSDAARWPIYDPRPYSLPPPLSNFNDAPRRVLCINDAWAGHIIGVLLRLERDDAWSSNQDFAREQIARIIEALSTPYDGDCPSSDGEVIPPDDGGITVAESQCGGIIVIGEEDMGQVVTNVYPDYETGELVVEFGPCCIKRYALSGEIIDAGTGGPPPDVTDPEAVVDIACRKAYWMAHELVAMADAAYTNAPGNWFDFHSVMKTLFGQFYEVDTWDYWKLYFVAQIAYAANQAPFSEVWSDYDSARLACLFKPHLNDTDFTLPKSEYSAALSAKNNSQNIAMQAVLDGAWECFGYTNMQVVAANAKNITGYSCDCPDAPGVGDNETVPTSAGWYWGAAFELPYQAPGGFDSQTVPEWAYLDHDAYGIAWMAHYTSGDPLQRVKPNNDTTGWGLPFDHYWFGTNSYSDPADTWIVQAGDAAWSEIQNQLSGGVQRNAFLLSDNIAAPAVPHGDNQLGLWNVRAEGDPATSNGILKVRILYNINSPSHQ